MWYENVDRCIHSSYGILVHACIFRCCNRLHPLRVLRARPVRCCANEFPLNCRYGGGVACRLVFSETSGISDSGGGIFPSGKYSYFASIMEGRGTHSLAATIWTPSPIPNETSGVRAFRWKELRENRELYFSAWFLSSRPNQTHSVGRKFFHQTIKSVPFGNWVHFEVFLKQSNAFDGHVTFWQDGVKLFDFNNVKTSYFNSAFSSTTTAETQREDSKNARGNSRSIKNRFRR